MTPSPPRPEVLRLWLLLMGGLFVVVACNSLEPTRQPAVETAVSADTAAINHQTASEPESSQTGGDDPAGTCEIIAIDVPIRFAQDAAQCMPTAAAMAAAALGVPQTPRSLARRIRLHPDGAHFFDVEEALRGLGLSASTTVASLDHVAVALNRGLVPVLAVRRGAERHVVVLTRFEQCTDDAHPTFTWIDPTDGRIHRASSVALQASRSADQVLFVGRTDDLMFDDWPVEGAVVLRQANAMFRADTLYRRALEHGDPGDQATRLMVRANHEAPCWMPPRDWMHTHRPDDTDELVACSGR